MTPAELPRGWGNPSLKAGNTTTYSADSASFNSVITSNGFGAVAPIVAADTYVTVCDVVGAGLLYYAISPGYSSAVIGNGATLRITIDGTVYTIKHTTTTAPTTADRLVLGPLSITNNIGSGPDSPMQPNIAADYGFHTNHRVNGGLCRIPAGAALIAPIWIDSLNLPRSPFEKALKVEAKADVLGAGEYLKAMAIYALRA